MLIDRASECIDFPRTGDAHRYLRNQTTVMTGTTLVPAPVHFPLTRENSCGFVPIN